MSEDEYGDYRVERDSMGEVRVPAAAKWRAQTQRAVENFPISGLRVDRELIGALASIKGASAVVRSELGLLDAAKAGAVHDAAVAVARGDHDEQFPVDVFQTGSGTSTNMNMNEVLATLASELLGGAAVHPNDDVNDPLSSNDQFPSAIHIAAVRSVHRQLAPALEHLAQALERKRDEWRDVVKAGRTHLMDATPVTLGQEMGGYAAQVRIGLERLRDAMPRVGELPLGGTAVGTGINAPEGFAQRVIAKLASDMQLPLTGRAITSRRRARATRSSSCPGCCAPSRSGSTSARTTCAGCRAVPEPGSPRSTYLTCSRGRASCRARSIRSCPRRCAKSSRRSWVTTPRSRSAGRPGTSSST
ncbi:MAG: fumarate hydratase, class [Frankiaceae bacterium]|nr:fumarate hydratase, class [Frankiaceae bacterium]